MKKINALLVYPKFPPSFWGGNYSLPFIGKRATMPPLGLLTVAALFPNERYELKLIDMNVEPLTDQHLAWADAVFTSTMLVQKDSHLEVIARCQALDIPVIAGGPYPTTYHEEIPGVTHFVLGEVEDYFLEFLENFEAGKAGRLNHPPSDGHGGYIKPDMTRIPLPRYDLIRDKLRFYGTMCLQYSRGCPFDCDFCDITKLYGRVPRVKPSDKVIAELQLLYDLGWREGVFFVDDNFIGNKLKVRKDLLPALTEWQRMRNSPFCLSTEASVNLAAIEGLPEAMVNAGFDMVFLGLETPNPEALEKTNKGQNVSAENPDYLLDVVHDLQAKGLEVTGGFIVGLDGDTHEGVFDQMIDFVTQAGVPTAMVGLLTVIKNTNLYHQYIRENRLLQTSTGDNVFADLNYIPEMDAAVLIAGWKRVLNTLYDKNLKNYYLRSLTLIRNLKPVSLHKEKITWQLILALFRIFRKIVLSPQGFNFLRFIFNVLRIDVKKIPLALSTSVKGYHFQKITAQISQVEELNSYLQDCLEWLRNLAGNLSDFDLDEFKAQLKETFARINSMKKRIHKDYQRTLKENFVSLQKLLNTEFSNILTRAGLQVPKFVTFD